MAKPYSTLLCEGTLTTAGAFTTIYTVAAGTLVVVRDVVIANTAGSAIDIFLRTQPGLGLIINSAATPTSGTARFDGRQVINAGGDLELYAQQQPVRYRISGYVFNL